MTEGVEMEIRLRNRLTHGKPYRLDLHDWYDFAAFYQVMYLKSYAKLAVLPGENILDAGAHIGTWAVLAGQLAGSSGKVVAVEPDRENFRKLVRNIEMNGLNNVHPVRAALWSSRGKTVVLEGQGGMARIGDHGDQEVTTETIDHLAEAFGPFHRIKMDIEGAEMEALKGARQSLARCLQLSLEVHGPANRVAVEAQLREDGFKAEMSPAESMRQALKEGLLHPFMTLRLEWNNRFRTSRRVWGGLTGRGIPMEYRGEVYLVHAHRPTA